MPCNSNRRSYCPDCGEELIHRDNRRHFESASAFGQIVFREGPKEITYGDIDGYFYKRTADGVLLRLVERFQNRSPMKKMQKLVLVLLDEVIRHAAICQDAKCSAKLLDGSGVFIVRGDLLGSDHGRRKVDFAGRQAIETVEGELFMNCNRREELWDFFNGNDSWTRRDGKPKRSPF